jgi:hypothetical protein
MQNKKFRFGPIALTTALTTNLLNPGAASGGVNAGTPNLYILIQHIRVVNKHASIVAKVSLWLGATAGNAAGTEVSFQATPVALGGSVDAYYAGGLRLDVADFLVGGADTATALTIEGEGEIGVAG